MRFGIVRIQNLPLDELAAHFRQIEAWGFDHAWIYDHLSWPPGKPPEPWFECWTVLPALFHATSTLRIGPLVASMTLRNPTMLAAHAATVDHLSGGRLELGIGAAGALRDHRFTGVPEWSRRERIERLREYMEIVTRLLAGDVVDHVGAHYHVRRASVTPGSVQEPRIPVTLAALGPRSIAIAAAYADTWNSLGYGLDAKPVFGDQELDVLRARTEQLEAACRELGRDSNDLQRSYLTSFGRREEMPPVEDFSERVRSFAEIGVTDLIIHWPEDDRQYDALVAIAQALPELRAL
ncbi:MAG: LLM class flavin-dependent oxidoreductase [Actinomycetota bacterium]